MPSPAAPRDAGFPASLLIFPDEILGEIFLRLDSADDLARASAACTAFLRVARFLRRNRSLYRRPVVGFLRSEGPALASRRQPRSLHHAEPPHPDASAGRALAQLVDLSFSFLPDPSSWRICDAGDGRFLLASGTTRFFMDLVVCDPLHRRYVRIPPVPDDLHNNTSPDDLPTGNFRWGRFPLLASTGESSFGVAWMVKLDGKAKAFIFSSATGKWRRVTFGGWRGTGAVMITSCGDYAHRSLCHTSGLFTDVLMLDTRRMEFSVVRLPRVGLGRLQAIVEAGEGRLGLLTIGDGMLDLHLHCKAWQDNRADNAEEWQHEKTIPLPDAGTLRYSFCGVGAGYLLLRGYPQERSELASSSQEVPKVQYFTLEVKTLLMERFCLSNKCIDFAHLYANFPLLSLPTV
ncbi:unnamed protein product [Urochloa humidicola]